MKNRRKGLNRSNFFQKDEKDKEKKVFSERRKSIFDKSKIIEFLKEEERKKVQKMGFLGKVKNLVSVIKSKDEDLLSKYFIKGSTAKNKKGKK